MGAGTITSRLGALLFAKSAGIDVQLVPFKGSAEIGQAVLAGTVDFAPDSTGSSLPLIQAGQYRAPAKYSNRPLAILPDVPRLSVAAGLPGPAESFTLVAPVGPRGSAAAIVDKIHREVASIYADAAISSWTNVARRTRRTLGASDPSAPRLFLDHRFSRKPARCRRGRTSSQKNGSSSR